jgi:hypothetical protein
MVNEPGEITFRGYSSKNEIIAHVVKYCNIYVPVPRRYPIINFFAFLFFSF